MAQQPRHKSIKFWILFIIYFQILFLITIYTQNQSNEKGQICSDSTKSNLNCEQCSSSPENGCTLCKEGYHTNRVPEGAYLEFNYASCQKCHDNCEICTKNANTDSSFHSCAKAKGQRYLDYENEEIKDCNNNCFQDTNDLYNRLIPCPEGCTSCVDGENEVEACTEVKKGYAQDLVNGKVLPCRKNCLECTDRQFYCLPDSCEQGTILTNDQRACAKHIDGCDKNYLTPEGYCMKCKDPGMVPNQEGNKCVNKPKDSSTDSSSSLLSYFNYTNIIPFIILIVLITISTIIN